MKQNCSGFEFKLIRLFLKSRIATEPYYQRYSSGYYFNVHHESHAIVIFREQIKTDKHTDVVYLFDIYLSIKEFNFLMEQIK